MPRYVRFAFANNSGMAHLLTTKQDDRTKKETVCGQTLRCTSSWEGTATEEKNIRGSLCARCCDVADLPEGWS